MPQTSRGRSIIALPTPSLTQWEIEPSGFSVALMQFGDTDNGVIHLVRGGEKRGDERGRRRCHGLQYQDVFRTLVGFLSMAPGCHLTLAFFFSKTVLISTFH